MLAHDLGIAPSYSDVKYLHEKWGLDDLISNHVCLEELAENLPGTMITDNDDWLCDSVTGEK